MSPLHGPMPSTRHRKHSRVERTDGPVVGQNDAVEGQVAAGVQDAAPVADRPTTPAEDDQRAKETNAFLQSSARQGDAESGARAKYRHLGGSMLLQEQVYRK